MIKRILGIGLPLVVAALLGQVVFTVLASGSANIVDKNPVPPPIHSGTAVAAAASITLTEVITSSAGLANPVDIAHAGDSRLFIVEKEGRIRIYNGTAVLPSPFLDITTLVASGGSLSGEAGLLGLAFHPDYAANGYFYVSYLHQLADTSLILRVARYQVSAGDPDLADPATGTVLLEIPQDRSNHNGGDLNFGPNDGFLYISSGDGGIQGDPNNHAQSDTGLAGKILRIDVDGSGGADCDTSGSSNYDIPAGNPWVDGLGGSCDEIWSKGLRNPWRFSFDSATADMWIGDVGRLEWEEVDFQPAASAGGENWGWRCYEGIAAYNLAGCGSQTGYEFPVYAYKRVGYPGDCSVIGGFVYRGTAVPALTGHYLFADYCSAQFWSLSGGSHKMLTSFGLPDVQDAGVFGRPTTFGEDMNGELYVAENGANASIFMVSAVVQPSENTLAMPLYAGWNMISSFIEPHNPLLETLLAGIENDMILIKNGMGQVYWPAMLVNDIVSWDVRHGYQIYMSSPAVLLIEGQPLDPALTPLDLPPGWSLAAYLRDNPMPPDQALTGISDEFVLSKNGRGEVYWPAYGVNEIGQMQPVEGYQLYMDSAAILTYPPD